MKSIICFGAGYVGKRAIWMIGKDKIRYLVDNDSTKWGKQISGIETISPERLRSLHGDYECIITCQSPHADEIANQLDDWNIKYSFFDCTLLRNVERLISYAQSFEDVILYNYNALHDISNIFYIDVGCNDPSFISVTKLFHDMKQTSGINIDPLAEIMQRYDIERPNDINLCMGIGGKDGELELYAQGGLSSFKEEYDCSAKHDVRKVPVRTLKAVCDTYIQVRSLDKQDIHFLKIDCEGFEKQVLLGADLKNYRPWIILLEATEPCTEIPSWDEWEDDLLKQGYHFVMMYGVNRYYVANEHAELDENFLSPDDLKLKYLIMQAQFNIIE